MFAGRAPRCNYSTKGAAKRARGSHTYSTHSHLFLGGRFDRKCLLRFIVAFQHLDEAALTLTNCGACFSPYLVSAREKKRGEETYGVVGHSLYNEP